MEDSEINVAREEGNEELEMENRDDHEASQERNILVLGKIGAGKASIANAILGSCVFFVGTSIQSTTRECNDTIAVKEHEAGCYKYKIALVDTVGVNKQHQDEEIQRISKALKSFNSLSMIILVFKLERFTPQERESFQNVISVLKSSFKDPSSITALVVTNCEQKDSQAKEEIRRDLALYGTATAEVVQFAQKGTFLVGLPKLSELPLALKQHYELIVKDDEQQLQELAKQASMSESTNPEIGPECWLRKLYREQQCNVL